VAYLQPKVVNTSASLPQISINNSYQSRDPWASQTPSHRTEDSTHSIIGKIQHRIEAQLAKNQPIKKTKEVSNAPPSKNSLILAKIVALPSETTKVRRHHNSDGNIKKKVDFRDSVEIFDIEDGNRSRGTLIKQSRQTARQGGGSLMFRKTMRDSQSQILKQLQKQLGVGDLGQDIRMYLVQPSRIKL
jgi:hypothetical protein